MTRYEGIVVFKFYKRVEVEAEGAEQAKQIVRSMEYDTNGLECETEVYDLWERS